MLKLLRAIGWSSLNAVENRCSRSYRIAYRRFAVSVKKLLAVDDCSIFSPVSLASNNMIEVLPLSLKGEPSDDNKVLPESSQNHALCCMPPRETRRVFVTPDPPTQKAKK